MMKKRDRKNFIFLLDKLSTQVSLLLEAKLVPSTSLTFRITETRSAGNEFDLKKNFITKENRQIITQ